MLGAGMLVLLGAGCSAAPIDVAHAVPGSLLDGLFAHWSFDDGPGGTVHDDSGNFRNGTVQGGTWTTGRFGGALSFANGQDVIVQNFPDATSNWTVSAWARIDEAQPGGTDYVTLVSTEIALQGGWELNVVPTAGDMRYHFAFFVEPNTTNTNDYDFVECACAQPGVWAQVAAVINNDTRTLRLYVNGVLKATATTRKAIMPGSRVLYMANWSDASAASRYFTGTLDDIAIWSRALVDSEVAMLATAPAPNP